VGDGAVSYTQANLSVIAAVLAACGAFEGVAPGYLNELAPTAKGANTVAVNTGGGLVDGKPYHNTVSVDVNVPSAVGAGNTRIDRIVLRAGWAAQTVRITRIAGTDAASPTAPALVQMPGTTYDISLCTVLVNTAGAVTVTDARTMAAVGTTGIADSAITGGKIAPGTITGGRIAVATISGGNIANLTITEANIFAGAVTEGKIGAGAVTEAKLGAGAVTSGKIGANAVIAGKLADGAVDTAARLASGVVTSGKLGANAVVAGKLDDGAVETTARLANDIVDDTKVGNRVPQFYRRQGGSATNWRVAGATAYTPTAVRMQGGHFEATGTQETITFPVAFSYTPLVLITTNAAAYPGAVWYTEETRFNAIGLANGLFVTWLAIGPE
jgi:hypothetical protein